MTALLDVAGLRVGYGDALVLDGVSLTVGRGEAVGLVGASGSGKSTLASAVLGLLPPGGRVCSGAVSLRGEDLLAASPARLRELRGAQIGYVTQDALRALNPTMRVEAQVAEAMAVHGAARDVAAERAAELFALVDLADEHRGAYPHELSGGQRQRVAIAAAIANSPALLIADEPTTGLDVVVQRRLLDLLADLRQRLGLALVLISHDPRVVGRFCGRVVQLDDRPLGAPRARRPAALRPVAPSRNGNERAGAVLELHGVSVTYRRRGRGNGIVPALREVDMTVGRGEIVGLIGRSGSGKTTLALAALGLVRPDSGEVRFDNRPLHHLREKDLRRERTHMHLIFQDAYDATADGMAAHRVLSEPLEIQGRRADRQNLRGALARAGLHPPERFLERRAGELSGGERQRLALARAFVAKPKLVVADEPTSMLDTELRLELVHRMGMACEHDGTSLLFITHDLALARHLCDRLVVLQEGRVVEHGPAETVLGTPRATETRTLLDAAAL